MSPLHRTAGLLTWMAAQARNKRQWERREERLRDTRSFARNLLCALMLLAASTLAATAQAEILESSDSHFVLRHEATSALSADTLWERLIEPSTWWESDHTFSGDAANLTLEVVAGGHWREDWDGNSVAHGRVLTVLKGRILTMEAPFGPLQAMGAYSVWTITITPNDDGTSTVAFDETAIAPPGEDMPAMAEAVNLVKSVAIVGLAGPPPK